MTDREHLIGNYRNQFDMARLHLADFSEADMVVRPAPGANHAAWQLGHLVRALSTFVNGVAPGAAPSLPVAFVERHGGKGAKLNDGFESKDQLLARFAEMNEAAVAWVGKLSEADMDKPTHEAVRTWAPTVGHLAYAIPIHSMVHIGQIQVIRRVLAKPNLF